MNLKAFIVTFTVENVVLAESPEEAISIIQNDNYALDTFNGDFEVTSASYLPGHWDDDCLVYHNGNDDISVANAREKGLIL